MNMVRRIKGWKLLPTREGRVVVSGKLSDGRDWVTSPVAAVEGSVIVTESGSTYRLSGSLEPGAWLVSLRQKMPRAFQTFVSEGLIAC